MNATGFYPRPHVDVAPVPAVGQAGGVLLTETVRATGLAAELSRALAPWRKQFSRHDPGKILTDLALMLAVGGTAWLTSRRSEWSRMCMDLWPRIRRSLAC